jgi:hypothetical protein
MARISLVTPEPATINIVILDALGNVVFEFNLDGVVSNEVEWDLVNQSGRLVASGTYLIIAEATSVSGRRFVYTGRIGVRR